MSRSSSAVVILASPNTLAHSLKLRFVVMTTLVRSYSLLSRWNNNAPPDALNGRYRAVDKAGATVDFLLRAKRDHAAARAFFERAIALHGAPDKVTIDKSGSNTAAIASIQADSGLPVVMRQSKYLNNLFEQDHRAVKRVTRPMMGFKSFWSARALIAGIETMHMLRKGQLAGVKDRALSPAQQFYRLAA